MAKKKITDKLSKNIQGLAAYKSFPLAQIEHTDPKSGTTTPPDEAVQQAKNWVDENKK